MATIARVEIRMVDLKPRVKRVDAIQSFVSQETPFVRITDSDGAVGFGYSYTIGSGGPAVVQLLARTLAPALIGREAGQVEKIWRDLLFLTHATSVGVLTSLALAAIDTALWDLRCKKAGLPLHIMAGGAKDRVPLYTTEGGWLHLPQQALVDDALQAQSLGFGGCKVKVGRAIHEDVERLGALRAALGAGFEILTDANQAFHVDEAIRRARHYEAVDIGWFEEPLPADDVDGHLRLSQSTTIPIAVGESLYSLSQFRDYLQRGACSIVQVDVARIGGVTPWLKTAHLAEAYNIAVCPHFLMELHVALCCAVPNSRWLEYIPQLDELTTEPMRIRDGHAEPSETPGLGVAWDFDAIERLTVEGSSHDLRASE
jgi:L-alanine-DL-glutamate epimerase-like enolase superfamily enzyme